MPPGGLGRRPFPDARDHGHLMAMALPDVVPPRPPSKVWRVWKKTDQGQTSECVGHSWHCLLRALPHLQREPLPKDIYDRAQQIDEWDDTPPAGGTSVRAGAKVLKALGKLNEYSWAFDLETVLNWMGRNGPTVWGVNWYTGMDTWDSLTGLIRVGGTVRGGHAVCCLGYDDRKQWLIFQNSWSNWGIKQRFKMSYTDAEGLLSEGGECCTPTEVMP